MPATRVSVTGEGISEYPVLVGAGTLYKELPAFIAEHDYSRVALITNDDLAPLYGEPLLEAINNSFMITIPVGEEYKTLGTLASIYEQLVENDADRYTAVIALGGGVVTDTAGFAAASFMRGIPLIEAPTTLLAMVDAAVGGKTGVDLPQGKNLVGAFKDPEAVFVDTNVLNTLPQVEFQCGMAEVVKAGIIGDPTLFDMIEAGQTEPIGPIIQRALAVKIDIVQQDKLEGGIRAHLNLGHTVAHALELVSGYDFRHGEAVAIGLVAGARLAAKLGKCSPVLVERITAAIDNLGLPVHFSRFDPEAVWNAMLHDKKWHHGVSYFVLPRDIGHVEIVKGIAKEPVVEVLASLKIEG